MTFDFIKSRGVFYGISLLLSIGSLVAFFMLPLHLGIDMTGGSQMEFSYSGKVDLAEIRALAELSQTTVNSGSQVINNTTAYLISGEDKFIIEAGFNRPSSMNDADFEALKTQLKNDLINRLWALKTVSVDLSPRYTNIGETFGSYIKDQSYKTILLVIVAISLYIAWAFRGSIEGVPSWNFAIVTGISLFHDVLIAAGLYVATSSLFPELKIDTFFITAMLTVLGYSINDTIVVMDRIRSNLRLSENKKKTLSVIVNNSINETIKRSIYTSTTVFLTLIALFFFGPASIHGFTLALIYGTIVGTYSSIVIAAPLLTDMNPERR